MDQSIITTDVHYFPNNSTNRSQLFLVYFFLPFTLSFFSPHRPQGFSCRVSRGGFSLSLPCYQACRGQMVSRLRAYWSRFRFACGSSINTQVVYRWPVWGGKILQPLLRLFLQAIYKPQRPGVQFLGSRSMENCRTEKTLAALSHLPIRNPACVCNSRLQERGKALGLIYLLRMEWRLLIILIV